MADIVTRVDRLTAQILDTITAERSTLDEALLALAEAQRFIGVRLLERLGMDRLDAEKEIHEVYDAVALTVFKYGLHPQKRDATKEELRELLRRHLGIQNRR